MHAEHRSRWSRFCGISRLDISAALEVVESTWGLDSATDPDPWIQDRVESKIKSSTLEALRRDLTAASTQKYTGASGYHNYHLTIREDRTGWWRRWAMPEPVAAVPYADGLARQVQARGPDVIRDNAQVSDARPWLETITSTRRERGFWMRLGDVEGWSENLKAPWPLSYYIITLDPEDVTRMSQLVGEPIPDRYRTRAAWIFTTVPDDEHRLPKARWSLLHPGNQ